MSDVNLTLQDNGGVYLAITETPAVVTLGAAVISGALASTVTVSNVVSVSVVTMPAINITPAAVTTVAGTVSISNFPASSSLTIANFPSVTTVTGTVALDQASLIALENVTVTVGSTVSISNLPATQTIAGTVTANVYGFNSSEQVRGITVNDGEDPFLAGSSRLGVQLLQTDGTALDNGGALPISGTVTANTLLRSEQAIEAEEGAAWGMSIGYFDGGLGPNGEFTNVSKNRPFPISGTVTVGNSVTIGSCVTHGVNVANSVTIGSLPVQLSTTTIGGTARLNVTLSSATTVGGAAPSYANLYGGSDGTNLRAILTDTSGRTVVTVSNFPSTQPVSLASLPSLAAGTAQIGSVTASINGTVPVSGTFWQATQPVSGTVTAAVASTTVTVSAMPSGTLTTRFGTPTTANTAFLTSAVTNTARKYLLIQNVTTGSNVITVGVGFVPTTTQGIQLAAGAGITFESSYIPTGAVWVLSSVTASNHTILEA